MFELSLPHILLLLVIALLVIGPKNLPDIAKTLGKMFGEFQRAADDLKREIKTSSEAKPDSKTGQGQKDVKTGEGPGTDTASPGSKTPLDKNS